jgi:hypothetical protein
MWPASPAGPRGGPARRPAGTVYGRGAALPGPVTTSPSAGPVETSGSLTGHILAQGAADRPTPKSRTAKVVLIMLVVLAILVALGLLGATVARDTISALLNRLIGG